MADAHNKKMTPDVKESILGLLELTPVISTVARMCGVSPRTVYKEMSNDEKWGEEVRDAQKVGYDTLEEEAIRRGRDGVKRNVYFQGTVVDQVTEYSDSLLLATLKANKPKKYNPGAKVTVDDGEKVSMVINIGGSRD